ncbi:MAG TPA: FAD-dependent monooxygenase [archaeon]|nr:FAD-dependent monooxygenase [archaeon]
MVVDFDIIVVGAGPAGSYFTSLVEGGFKVLVLEQKKQTGGKACSGLVSQDIKKFIPVDGLVESELDSCILHAASGKMAKLGIKQSTFALDRDRLDKFLVERLKSPVKFGVKVGGVEIGDGVKVKTNQGVFTSKFIVGCDGANSVVRNHFDQKPMDNVIGLMVMAEEKDLSTSFEVWFDTNLVKDGFLWKIPRGRRVEYGVLGTGIKFGLLEDFFKIKRKKCLCERRAAPIPAGFHKTYFDRTLLIGDAAAQTKPWSFGGILYGFIGGKYAAPVVIEALQKNKFTEVFLEKYQKGWRSEMGKSISMGMMFREFFQELNNKKIDQMFEIVKKSGLKEIDMDHPFIGLLGL